MSASRRWVTAGLLAAILGPSGRAAAAETSVGVATWSMGHRSPVGISPVLALQGQDYSVVGAGIATGSDLFRGGRLTGSMLVGPRTRRPLELRLESGHHNLPDTPERGGLRGEARLHFAAARSGAWMSFAGELGYGVAPQRVGGGGALVGFGAWAQSHGARFALDLEQRSATELGGFGPVVPSEDTLAPPPVPEQSLVRTTLTIARTSVRWEGSRLALETSGGVTMGLTREPYRWAWASMQLRLTPDITAFATIGGDGADRYLVTPAESPGARVGIQLANWRSVEVRPLVMRGVARRWDVRRIDDRSYALTVWAPEARRVEVMGDFTDWEPVVLHQGGRDRWSVVVALDPGVHKVTLRIDGGAWSPPPGVPQSVDGYSGTVGLVVVP